MKSVTFRLFFGAVLRRSGGDLEISGRSSGAGRDGMKACAQYCASKISNMGDIHKAEVKITDKVNIDKVFLEEYHKNENGI